MIIFVRSVDDVFFMAETCEVSMDMVLRRTLAKLIAGLQVSRSLPGVLGAGTESYDELRRMFNCFGWQTAEEIEGNIMRWEKKKVRVGVTTRSPQRPKPERVSEGPAG